MENIKRQVTAITSPEAEVKASIRETQETQAEIREINQIRAPRQQYPPRFSTTHQDQERRRRNSPPPRQCQYSGYNHRKSHNCPAFGKRCRKCNKENHFSSVCRSSSNLRVATRKQDSRSNDQRGRIKRTVTRSTVALGLQRNARYTNSYADDKKNVQIRISSI